VIAASDFAIPIGVAADPIRVSNIHRLNEIFAHQIAAIIRAAEPVECAILQRDGLQLAKNRFPQAALSCVALKDDDQKSSGGTANYNGQNNANFQKLERLSLRKIGQACNAEMALSPHNID
jgi:hypothetical protein